MSTFSCIAKTTTKTKINVFMQIGVPKKATLIVGWSVVLQN